MEEKETKHSRFEIVFLTFVFILVIVGLVRWFTRPYSPWVTPEFVVDYIEAKGKVEMRAKDSLGFYPVEVPVEILETFSIDEWEQGWLAKESGEQLSVYLGEEYEMRLFPEAGLIRLSYGYAPLEQKGVAYYRVPVETINTLWEFFSS